MHGQVRLRPQAAADIDEIAWTLTEAAGVETGLRLYDAVEAALDRLHAMPRLGAPRTFPHGAVPNVRMWVLAEFPAYLVFYVPDAEGIDVLRVLHGARNVEALFD